MKNYLQRLLGKKTPATKKSVSLAVERLDDRIVLSSTGAMGDSLVSAVSWNNGVTDYFARNQYGEVRVYSSNGLLNQHVDYNVVHMDAGHDWNGANVLYEIKTDGNLYLNYLNGAAPTRLTSGGNVTQITGSYIDGNCWYVQNGNVYEYTRQSYISLLGGRFFRPETVQVTGFGGGIENISAGTDASNHDVLYIQGSQVLWEYSATNTSTPQGLIGFNFGKVLGGMWGTFYADGVIGSGTTYQFTGQVSDYLTVGFTGATSSNPYGSSVEYGLDFGPTYNGYYGIYKGSSDQVWLKEDVSNRPTNFVGGGNDGFAELFDGSLWIYTPADGWVRRDGGY